MVKSFSGISISFLLCFGRCFNGLYTEVIEMIRKPMAVTVCWGEGGGLGKQVKLKCINLKVTQ